MYASHLFEMKYVFRDTNLQMKSTFLCKYPLNEIKCFAINRTHFFMYEWLCIAESCSFALHQYAISWSCLYLVLNVSYSTFVSDLGSRSDSYVSCKQVN